MMKIIPIAVPIAVLAFAAGVWTDPGRHPKKTIALSAPLMISPSEMPRNLKPDDDIPVQYGPWPFSCYDKAANCNRLSIHLPF